MTIVRRNLAGTRPVNALANAYRYLMRNRLRAQGRSRFVSPRDAGTQLPPVKLIGADCRFGKVGGLMGY